MIFLNQHIVHKLNRVHRRKSFIRRIEQRIVNAYELLANTWFFFRLGCRLRTAVYLARNIVK